MSEIPPTQATKQINMQRFREWVAAIISLLIIIGSFAMIGLAFTFIGTAGDQFSQVKDLLLFINPLLGVVIGYYFNKVTSDSRAETAESAFKTASVTAQQAVDIRDAAVAEAEATKADASEMKSSLEQLSQWAGDMVAQVPAEAAAGAKTLGVEEGVVPSQDLLRLRMQGEIALERARKILGK